MGLPPMMSRVTSCGPSLIVGNVSAAAAVAARLQGANSDKPAAVAARPAVWWRNWRRVVEGQADGEGGVVSSGFIAARACAQLNLTSNQFGSEPTWHGVAARFGRELGP